MIIPRFWAEGRIQKKLPDGKQVTMRRFGWSNTNQEDAQKMADERTATALQAFERGETVKRREWKVPYNGADGIPIREEVLESGEGWVVTRNSYGAKCINTPNVLIADIDFDDLHKSAALSANHLLLAVTLGVVTGWWFSSWWLGFSVPFAVGALILWLSQCASELSLKKAGGAEALALAGVESFSQKDNDWGIRVYRTPAGLRLLVTHSEFDPSSEESQKFLNSINADPMYIRMCDLQKCYRARLTAKPWRIGISEHLKPRPGTWPIKEEHMPRREKWVQNYDQKSENFAACRFLKELGASEVSAKVAPLIKIHDEMCGAHSGLPIA